MAGRFFPRIICMSRRIDGSAPNEGPRRTRRTHLNAARGHTRVRASVHTCKRALGERAARRIVEFPRWEFNFQMCRATRALSRTGAALFRERIISACNANFRDIAARYTTGAMHDLLEIPLPMRNGLPSRRLAVIKYSLQGGAERPCISWIILMTVPEESPPRWHRL